MRHEEPSMHIVCPQCFTVNRIPDQRLGDDPKCGKCHSPLLDGKPVALTSNNFDTFTSRNNLPVAVDFWAEWCGPCKMIAPMLSEIATEQKDKLTVAKLNVDEHPDLARRYDVMSIPTLLVFANGETTPVKRLVGAKGKGQLLEELREFLGTPSR
jgi:thioredoxin 2